MSYVIIKLINLIMTLLKIKINNVLIIVKHTLKKVLKFLINFFFFWNMRTFYIYIYIFYYFNILYLINVIKTLNGYKNVLNNF